MPKLKFTVTAARRDERGVANPKTGVHERKPVKFVRLASADPDYAAWSIDLVCDEHFPAGEGQTLLIEITDAPAEPEPAKPE